MNSLIKFLSVALLGATLIGYSPESDTSYPWLVAIKPKDDNYVVYFQGEPISSSNVQIGTTLCSSDVNNDANNMRTLILVDNSLEVYSTFISHTVYNQRAANATIDTPLLPGGDADYLTTFLKNVVVGHDDNEVFRIATIGGGFTYLTDYSTDYNVLMGVFDSISYSYCETNLLESLQIALNDLNDGSSCYSRIILISDCVDNNADVWSYNELLAFEEEVQIPIFLVAADYGTNSDDLALAETYIRTNSHSSMFNCINGSNMWEFNATVAADNSMQCVTVYPEPELMNGSTLGMIIDVTTDSDTYSYIESITLPIVRVTPSPIPTLTSTPIPTATPEPVETVEETEEIIVEETKSNDTATIVILCVVSLMGLGVLVYICMINRTRLYNVYRTFFDRTKSSNKNELSTLSSSQNETKRALPFGKKDNSDKTSNPKLDPNVAPNYQNIGEITFTDLSNGEEHTLQFKEYIIIGKGEGCSLKLNDGMLSDQQCRIYRRNNTWTLQNLNVINETKFNGVSVSTDCPLLDGGVLGLGRKAYRVTFRDI